MDYVFFGIQGSGKGTQAKRLVQEKGYAMFEAGGELRRIAASGTPIGDHIKSFIDQGNLVPFEVIMEVVRGFIEDHASDATILFDGVPRDTEQKNAFDVLMQSIGREFMCLNIVVNEEEAVERILGRAKEEGRADDASEETIRRRMGLFHEKTEPVIQRYSEQGKVIEIDGEGTMDEVFQRVLEAVGYAG